MNHEVRLSEYAERDLEEIADFIATYDSPGKAELVVERIQRAVDSLANTPHRGAYPPEALEFSNQEFREIFFKPYRIVYHVSGQTVMVLLIGDGRRNMRELLRRRLEEA